MSADVVLPNLGFGMEEGRLISWLKQPGETVKKGEPIAEIESDKAAVELEAVVDGILEDILVPADTVIPVGAVLAHIRVAADPVSSAETGSASPSLNTSVSLHPTGPAGEYSITPLA